MRCIKPVFPKGASLRARLRLWRGGESDSAKLKFFPEKARGRGIEASDLIITRCVLKINRPDEIFWKNPSKAEKSRKNMEIKRYLCLNCVDKEGNVC